MALDLRYINVRGLRVLVKLAEERGYKEAVHELRAAAEALWALAQEEARRPLALSPEGIGKEDEARLQAVVERFLPVRTNAGGEGPFPETVVHAHLDGAMRKYIPVDGEELAEHIRRAEQGMVNKIVAWLRRDYSRNRNAVAFADALEKREFEVER